MTDLQKINYALAGSLRTRAYQWRSGAEHSKTDGGEKMKNTTAMLEAISKTFIRDLEDMTREELIAELTHYIDQSILEMNSDQIHSTYQLIEMEGRNEPKRISD